MASACVNNIGVLPEMAPATFPAYGWLGPSISFSRDYADEDSKKKSLSLTPDQAASDPSKDAADFEFRLDDPVAMLPADELFSDGKLVPLHLTATVRHPTPAASTAAAPSPQVSKSSRMNEAAARLSADPYLFSPKAPRCSSRWRELLGLRKHKSNSETTSSSSSSGKSIRQFLLRNSKSSPESSSSDASLNKPLLKDSDCESLSVSSSRISLSSTSSSGHDFDDLPRLSLDSDNKPIQPHTSLPRPRVRMVKPRMVPSSIAEDNPKPLIDHPSAPAPVPRSGVTADSPRMSSSGKIVFQSLERSSSSPSSFNGGPRHKHRGMERSYSSNVRITPVLNVPVCSLRGSSKSGVFGLFSSQSQKKDGNNGSSKSANHNNHHHNRTCRVRRESS